MRSFFRVASIAALLAAPVACSSAPREGVGSGASEIVRSCNPSHHHATCPPEGDPRWCDCLSPTSCLDTGCPDPAAPICNEATTTCVECGASTDCHDSAKPFCDATTGACYACKTDRDCNGFSTTLSWKCDTLTRTCGECASDADCHVSPIGEPDAVCVPQGSTHVCR